MGKSHGKRSSSYCWPPRPPSKLRDRSFSIHWGQVVVFPPGTLQVHHKEMDSVPAMNPPRTLQIHFEFPTQFTSDTGGNWWCLSGPLYPLQSLVQLHVQISSKALTAQG